MQLTVSYKLRAHKAAFGTRNLSSKTASPSRIMSNIMEVSADNLKEIIYLINIKHS